MQPITIYSKPACPYCDRAKELLQRKGASYQEINIQSDMKYLEEMLQKSGGRKTVPQIFIGQTHVGGYDDLYALDTAGKLDSLLKSA